MRIGIVAGEASGDVLGAALIAALRTQEPSAQFVGVAGPAMQAAGCQSLYAMERLSVMGLIEPLMHLPDLFKLRRGLIHYFSAQPPDVFIGIDAPDFNLGLELKLRQAGIRTVHYVSPSVWAWRQRRVFKIAKATDLMLTLLPFEAQFYQKHQIPVRYVGHPLADQIPLESDQRAARRALGVAEEGIYVALLPGSRRQEIRYLSECFLQAAKIIQQHSPHIQFLTSHINEDRSREFFAQQEQCAAQLPLQGFIRRTHEVMAAADIVIVGSGTATLETMLFKRPMVIAYRMASLTYQLAKYLVKVPHIGLPNLLAQKRVVPEFIQHAATPENIAESVLDYLTHPEKIQAVQQEFMTLHQSLRMNSAESAAKAILECIKTS